MKFPTQAYCIIYELANKSLRTCQYLTFALPLELKMEAAFNPDNEGMLEPLNYMKEYIVESLVSMMTVLFLCIHRHSNVCWRIRLWNSTLVILYQLSFHNLFTIVACDRVLYLKIAFA